jgi:membrane protein
MSTSTTAPSPPLHPTLHPSDLWPLSRDAVTAWIDDGAPSMGAALAYYTLFSIAPLLLIVIAVAGAVFGADAARGEIFSSLRGLLGAEGAAAIESLLASVQHKEQAGLGALVGTALLLVGATTVFAELQSSLDRIWRVPPRPMQPGWWAVLRARLLSFGLILGVGFLLMVSLVASAALTAWGRWWAPMFGGFPWLLDAANATLGFALTTLLFAMIFKFMPSVRIAWRDVALGAVLTATLFSIGKWLIALYIGTTAVASGFGAAGSLVVLMIWVYGSAQIFLVGAEFTRLVAQRRHSGPELSTVRPQP